MGISQGGQNGWQYFVGWLIKFTCLVSILVASFATAAHGDTSAGDWTLNTSVFSKYVGTIGGDFYDHPILVNELTYSIGNCYLGIWNSTGLGPGAYGKTFGDEFDLYAGWIHQVGVVKYEITALYFAIADLRKSNDDLWVVDQKLSFPTMPVVEPYIKVRAFNRVGSQSPSGGWFLWCGITREQNLGMTLLRKALILNADLTFGYSDGPLGKSPGPVFGRLTIGIPVRINKRLLLTPSIARQYPLGGQAHSAKPFTTSTETVGGITATSHF